MRYKLQLFHAYKFSKYKIKSTFMMNGLYDT